jgi:acetate kinase
MSGELLVTFNAGSSTVKLGVFAVGEGAPRRIGKGVLDLRLEPLTFHLAEGPVVTDVALKAVVSEDLHAVLDEVLGWLGGHFDMGSLVAACHRVVHGGDRFTGAARVDGESLAAMEALVELAPLHQPQNLRLVRAIGRLRPGLAQTASFDTAFHRTQTEVVRRFALPRRLHDAGVKRYGFHGLSYQFIAGALPPEVARGKVVAAHLGSGASLCGMEAGVSRDSSMGFSTLDGVPMATRPGALDAGVVLHLLGGMSAEAVSGMLYHEAGLLGMSGISADSRVLLASDRAEAREALEVFTFRVAGEVARLAATLGGIDALVFTAGVGEHQPEIREMVCLRLGWLGVELEAAANAANARAIGAGRVGVFVIATDEEQVIADEGWSVLKE